MNRLFLGMVVALGMLAADAFAGGGCIGCGQVGMQSGPVPCDQSVLWNDFAPTQASYKASCWSAGCNKGIFGGHVVGLLDRLKSHACSGGSGIACNGTAPGLGWDSMGDCCGGPGLGGYGGSSLATFHGMSYAGPRLMGNSQGGCCPNGNAFAGPCGYGGVSALSGCGGCAGGWLSGLMERLRSHCSSCSYSGGSLDPCGSLSGCGGYPAGNLNLSFGDVNYGGCASGSCGGGCASGTCGSGGCGGGVIDGGLVSNYGGAGCGGGVISTPTPTPHNIEPQPAGGVIEAPTSHPSASYGQPRAFGVQGRMNQVSRQR